MGLADEQFRPESGEAHEENNDQSILEDVQGLFELPQVEEHREETAGELAPDTRVLPGQEEAPPQESAAEEAVEEAGDGAVWSWAGLVLSLLSFLVMPLFLGIVGMGLGYVGFRQGARNTGVWAMGLGALSILASLLITPYFVR